MRYIILLALIAVLAQAFIEIKHDDGDDILVELRKRNNGVILVLFVIDLKSDTKLAEDNYEFEYHLIHKVLYDYPAFKYARVNALDPAYKNLVKATGLSISDLYNSPSILISEDRDGEWIHGDRTLTLIKRTARVYNERVQD